MRAPGQPGSAPAPAGHPAPATTPPPGPALAAGPAPAAVCTAEQVIAALREVLDPEYPVSVVDLGLIRGVAVQGGEVRVRLTFTSMGCPCMEMIQDDIVARLGRLPGVDRVTLEVVWEPWTRAHISEEGWRRLRGVGVV